MSGKAQLAAAEPSREVVDALVENHRRFLAFLERKTGDRALAEDLLQAAMVRGLERGGEIRESERSVAWFYRLLRNAVVDHWRHSATEKRALEALAREPTTDWRADDLDEICHCFVPLLDTLSPQQASILRRVDLEGARPSDVARDDGVTANAAMVRLHRARRALRERLVAACGTCAEHGCLDCSCTSPCT